MQPVMRHCYQMPRSQLMAGDATAFAWDQTQRCWCRRLQSKYLKIKSVTRKKRNTNMSRLSEALIRHSASTNRGSPDVWGIYESDTGSIQYICADPATKKAALIDVVLYFDPASFALDTRSMEQVLELVDEQRLTVEWVLDTHPHAVTSWPLRASSNGLARLMPSAKW